MTTPEIGPDPHRLRDAGPDDAAFLRELFVEDRRGELLRSGCSPEQLHQLLELQLTARERGYAAQFPAARCQIIERRGRPVGRILVAEVDGDAGDELRVVDLAVSESARRRGAATAALRHVIDRAEHEGRVISLQMAAGNPAGSLYAGLGFGPTPSSGPLGAAEPSPTHLVHLRRPARRKAHHV